MSAEGDIASYKRLFGAYGLALLGTGVAVVGLALLAFELAGEAAAPAVIATALSLKMLAYVVGAPLAAAFLADLPPRPLIVALDLVRAGAILFLPFADAVWQLYAMILLFTLASAAFTPAYQACVASLLPGERDYAGALARARVIGEIEGAVSPLIAAALLSVLSLGGLFVAAMATFLLSAALIAAARLPPLQPSPPGALKRLADGFRPLFATPALRGLPPLALAAGLGAAAVTVNTAPLVLGRFDRGADEAAIALAVFGAAAAVGAIAMPRLLRRLPERIVMLGGGAAMAIGVAASATVSHYATLLALWAAAGAGAALAQAPAGALIRRATPPRDHQTVYAAHFALSNAALGIGYAATGALEAALGIGGGIMVLATLAATAAGVAALAWPARGHAAAQ